MIIYISAASHLQNVIGIIYIPADCVSDDGDDFA